MAAKRLTSSAWILRAYSRLAGQHLKPQASGGYRARLTAADLKALAQAPPKVEERLQWADPAASAAQYRLSARG